MPPLLPTIAHITDDYSLLRDDLKPDPLLIRDIEGGMTEAQQSQTRSQARRSTPPDGITMSSSRGPERLRGR